MSWGGANADQENLPGEPGVGVVAEADGVAVKDFNAVGGEAFVGRGLEGDLGFGAAALDEDFVAAGLEFDDGFGGEARTPAIGVEAGEALIVEPNGAGGVEGKFVANGDFDFVIEVGVDDGAGVVGGAEVVGLVGDFGGPSAGGILPRDGGFLVGIGGGPLGFWSSGFVAVGNGTGDLPGGGGLELGIGDEGHQAADEGG